MNRLVTLLFLVVGFLSTPRTEAVDYPGPPPRPARAYRSATEVVLQNDAIAMRWTCAGGQLKPSLLTHEQSSSKLSLADTECFYFILGQSPDPHTRRINASDLRLAAPPEIQRIQPSPNAARLGDRFGGWALSARLVSAQPAMDVLWRAVLRDGANYIRQEITLRPRREPVEVAEAVLLEWRLPQAKVAGRVEGSPIVNDQWFMGVEHPAANNQIVAGETVRCGYPCNIDATPAEPLTLSAVIGVVPPGQQRRGFLYYLERERACPYRPFLHHNNGEQFGLVYWKLIGEKKFGQAATFRAGQERLWRELIERVGQELTQRRGARLDAFVHDWEWDDENLVWQFHNGYPDGFKPLLKVAARYGAGLGIWFSPWGGYTCKPGRLKEGRRLGFEINQGGLSLAGPRYYSRFRESCLGLMRDHGVKYFKFDGFAGTVHSKGSGEYRSDVEALWRLLRELREADPRVFINTSTGSWPSPFWLLHTDSIWRGGFDTGTAGAKGSERQQWITYRDAAVHNTLLANGPLYPISSLMIHGIIINGGGRVKTFIERDLLDEIRAFFATGVNLQELYLAPEYMTAATWDTLAESAKWSRANAGVLADTHWVGGDPAKGEVYGWASWSKRKGILSLRNPSDRPAILDLKLARAFELPGGAARAYSLKSPWVKDRGTATIRLEADDPHAFTLHPFEVLTLEATPEQ